VRFLFTYQISFSNDVCLIPYCSYMHMTDLVDQMFPPIHRKWANEFTDFNYWKAPVQEFLLPDLTPPSPALSARSDTSNQSTLARLRNFSLGYTSNRSSLLLPPPATADQKSPQLKQMSSFERLGVALSGFAQSSSSSASGSRRSMSRESRTSSSLTYADSVSDDEYGDEGEWNEVTKRRRQERTRSLTSMPGSLDDFQFTLETDEDDHIEDGHAHEGQGDDEGEGEDDEGIEEGEGATEEAFDEDFLATTQMKHVPFL
jgi:phosphatidate phosphatase LPIN